MDTTLLRNQPPFVLDRETAPAMWLVETLWLFLATGNQTCSYSCFIEQVMGAGLGPPAHRHPQAVKGFYVLEGAMTFHIEGRELRAEAGTVLYIPRTQPHTFTVGNSEIWSF